MVAQTAFKVLTEFKFDVGQAVVGSETLQRSVTGISDAAAQAQNSLVGLSLSFGAGLIGTTGLLGLMGKSITVADQFKQSQLSFSNILSANMENLIGDVGTFNNRMMLSGQILKDISKDAATFGLPVKELESTTKMMAALLTPKGLAGTNFDQARILSRNLLKSAPNLGVDPGEVQGQLIRMIEGSASMGDTLFRRLAGETNVFKDAKVKDTKSFNAMDLTKRFELIQKALGVFSSDMDVLKARAYTLDGMLQRLKDTFSGIGSILKPLGEVLLPPLLDLMDMGIKYLQTEGATLVKQFAAFIKPFVENPKKLFLEFMQLKNLAADVGKATAVTGIVVTLMHLKELLHFVSSFAIGRSAIAGISNLFRGLMPLLGGLGLGGAGAVGTLTMGLTKLLPYLGIFALGVGKVLLVFGFFVAVFQAFSRALAMSKLEVLEAWAANATRIGAAILSIKESFALFLAPLNWMIEGLAHFFNLFMPGALGVDLLTGSLESTASTLEFISDLWIRFFAGLRGVAVGVFSVIGELFLAIQQIFVNLSQGNILGMFEGVNLGDSLAAVANNVVDDFYNTISRRSTKIDEGEGVAKSVTNVSIGKVENRFDFKEKIEPDRVAFAVESSLTKLARNPTQAQGKSFSSGIRMGQGMARI